MPVISAELLRLATARHGVVTADELLADGATPDAVAGLVARGLLVRRHRRTFRLAVAPDTFESRCAAACLADAEAVVTGPAAARLRGFAHVFRPNVPEVLVRHDRTPITRGVHLRRTNVLDERDVERRPDGIRVASVERTWFDCACHLPDERFELLTAWLLGHGVPVSALYATARRLDARGRTGLARVHRVMSARDEWRTPPGCGLGADLRRALHEAGVEGLRPHPPLELAGGVLAHLDAAVPALRWAVEIEHVGWHGGRATPLRRGRLDRQLERRGWQVEVVTDVELRERWPDVVDHLVASRRRRAAPASAPAPAPASAA